MQLWGFRHQRFSLFLTAEDCGHERAGEGVYRKTRTCPVNSPVLSSPAGVVYADPANSPGGLACRPGSVPKAASRSCLHTQTLHGASSVVTRAPRHGHPEPSNLSPEVIKISYLKATSPAPPPGRRRVGVQTAPLRSPPLARGPGPLRAGSLRFPARLIFAL